jgi:class 3 adenylate cyclase
MARLPLRNRILLVSSALAALLTVAMLALVSAQAGRFVDSRLIEDLRRGRDLVIAQEHQRLTSLKMTAQVLGSFPALKALVETTDAATVRDSLLEYRQQHLPSGLLGVLDTTGLVMAWTDGLAAAPIADVESQWLRPSLATGSAVGTLAVGDRVFHAAVVPLDAAGTLFGFLLAGARIDDAYASTLRESGRDDVVILSDTGVLASTLLRDRLPWQNAAGLSSADQASPLPFEVRLDGERYTALTVPTAPGARLVALTLQSRDQALAPYRLIQGGLLVLGFVAIVAGVGGSAMLARSITRPVARLVEGTQAVASGRYDFELAVDRDDELGDLAASFNTMTRGLRERDAMAKFMSHSTVEMIQARDRRAESQSERRVITVLFSDIRGFTAIAEQRAPEEAVSLLNQCLRVQAEIVARFNGDVDKFIGDAVFAHFAGADMAVNAIRCAVEIHHAMAARAREWGPAAIEVGVGIATGEVILGSVGSADRLDYTALGSTVNLCSRLCSVAGPREILLSESTFAAVRDFIAADPMEPMAVKGFAAPVRTFRMTVQSGVGA